MCGVVVFDILGRGGEGREGVEREGEGRGGWKGEGRGGEGMKRKHQVFVCSVSAACNGTDLHIAPLLVQRIPQPFADHLHDNALSK